MAKKPKNIAELDKWLDDKFNNHVNAEIMKTDVLVLDIVLNGGIPRGQMIELFSDSGLGKSTLVMSACRGLCAQGRNVIYLDFEGVSNNQIEGMGLSQYLHSQSNPSGTFRKYRVRTYGEAEEILDSILPLLDVSLVVIDSVTAMVNDNYLDFEKGTSVTAIRPGGDARALSIWLKKYNAVKALYNVSFMFINQVRTSINMLGGPSRDESTGGNAMRFYMDARLKLSPLRGIVKEKETINGKENVKVGAEVYLEAVKSRLGYGFIKVPMTILFGKGVSNIATYVQWLQNKDVNFEGKKVKALQQGGGGYYTFTLEGKQEKVRGIDNVTQYVYDNYDLISEMFTAKDFELMQSEPEGQSYQGEEEVSEESEVSKELDEIIEKEESK